jgi:hypothetical protein
LINKWAEEAIAIGLLFSVATLALERLFRSFASRL